MQGRLIKIKGDSLYLRSANKEYIDLRINRMGVRKLPYMIPQAEIKQYL